MYSKVDNLVNTIDPNKVQCIHCKTWISSNCLSAHMGVPVCRKCTDNLDEWWGKDKSWSVVKCIINLTG